ncbi:MAG: GNAT family N-acetyltransferase [Candidatus Bathyarchaeia archaeon]
MFHVKKMSPNDFDFAVCLTDTMNWELIQEDFEFMKNLEPDGCFTLFYDSEKVGITTTISYGKVGWIGDVIVHEAYRGKGGGSLLIKSAIDYLVGKGAETVGLYSYVYQVPFYEKHDFEISDKFIVMQGKGFSNSRKANVRKVEENDHQQIIDLDKSFFGTSRNKLLRSLLNNQNNLCYVSTNHERLICFAIAKVYGYSSELGPLVCRRKYESVAIDLLKFLLNRLKNHDVYLYVPEKEIEIINLLSEHNFKEKFHVVRMFRGKPLKSDLIYLAESLERG